MINGVFVSAYFIAASKIDISSPASNFPFPKYLVTPPSVPGTIKFLMRTLAKVPRVITKSLPRRLHRLFDFTQARPEIAQESHFPVFVFAERFSRKIDIYPASQRKSNDQWRRHQKIRFDVLMHARFEIAVPRKHRGCNQIELVD